jgi:hypothetical protein
VRLLTEQYHTKHKQTPDGVINDDDGESDSESVDDDWEGEAESPKKSRKSIAKASGGKGDSGIGGGCGGAGGGSGGGGTAGVCGTAQGAALRIDNDGGKGDGNCNDDDGGDNGDHNEIDNEIKAAERALSSFANVESGGSGDESDIRSGLADSSNRGRATGGSGDNDTECDRGGASGAATGDGIGRGEANSGSWQGLEEAQRQSIAANEAYNMCVEILKVRFEDEREHDGSTKCLFDPPPDGNCVAHALAKSRVAPHVRTVTEVRECIVKHYKECEQCRSQQSYAKDPHWLESMKRSRDTESAPVVWLSEAEVEAFACANDVGVVFHSVEFVDGDSIHNRRVYKPDAARVVVLGFVNQSHVLLGNWFDSGSAARDDGGGGASHGDGNGGERGGGSGGGGIGRSRDRGIDVVRGFGAAGSRGSDGDGGGDNVIHFESSTHTYSMNGVVARCSATQLVDVVLGRFDAHAVAARQTNSESAAQALQAKWRMQRDAGVGLHRVAALLCNGAEVPEELRELREVRAIDAYLRAIQRESRGVFAEVKLFDLRSGVAGAADLVIHHDDATATVVDLKRTVPTERSFQRHRLQVLLYAELLRRRGHIVREARVVYVHGALEEAREERTIAIDDAARREAEHALQRAPWRLSHFAREHGLRRGVLPNVSWAVLIEAMANECFERRHCFDVALEEVFAFLATDATVATVRSGLLEAQRVGAGVNDYLSKVYQHHPTLTISRLAQHVSDDAMDPEPPVFTVYVGVDPNTGAWAAAVDDAWYTSVSAAQYHHVIQSNVRQQHVQAHREHVLGKEASDKLADLGHVWSAESPRTWLANALDLVSEHTKLVSWKRGNYVQRGRFQATSRKQRAVHVIRATMERRLRKRGREALCERLHDHLGRELSEEERKRVHGVVDRIQFFIGYGNGGGGHFRGHKGSLKGPMRLMAARWAKTHAATTTIVSEAYTSQRATPGFFEQQPPTTYADFVPLRNAVLTLDESNKRKTRKRREAEEKKKEKQAQWQQKHASVSGALRSGAAVALKCTHSFLLLLT